MMALTGIFLILFLAVHLAGNLQLLKDDGGKSFNVYADFMSSNPLIQTVSKVNFLLIIVHVVWAILLTRRNRAARGPVGYAESSGKSSPWTSRNMGILGTILLVFIVTHLKDFWFKMHYGEMPTTEIDGETYKNIYLIVVQWFEVGWYVGLYVFCMAAVGFHLYHGFASAFQTLGLNHLKYNGLIAVVGKTFSIVVPALFAAIPLVMYFK